MNQVPPFPSGPLFWVKPEIDFALDRARSCLATHFLAPTTSDDALSAAVVSVREVTGALQIIGMRALARLSKEIDVVLEALARHEIEAKSEVRELVERAIGSLEQHLGESVAGTAARAPALLAVLGDLARVRGAQPVDERELFFPNLDVSPPPYSSESLLEGDALIALVKLQRGQYQRGMLSWLRKSEEGLAGMRDALQVIEHAQSDPQRRAAWWVASAFLEALLNHGIGTCDQTRRAAGKIDRCLAEFLSGAPASEDFVRELLFHLAYCPPVTPLVLEVQSIYQLDRYVEAIPAKHCKEAPTPELVKLRDLLGKAKRALDGPDEGRRTNCTNVQECIKQLCQTASDLGSQSASDLLTAMGSAAVDLDVVAIDRGTTIILELEDALLALENVPWNSDSGKSRRHIESVQRRLLAVASGTVLEPSAPERRHCEEQELLSAVAREMFTTVQDVEHRLDAYFRGQAAALTLSELVTPMRSVTGAFSMLGIEAASQLVEQCTSIVQKLADPAYSASAKETMLLAEGLSGVMLLVQALGHGHHDELVTVEAILSRFGAGRTSLDSPSCLDHPTNTCEGDPARHAEPTLHVPEQSANSESFVPNTESSEPSGDVDQVTNAELAEILDQFELGTLQDDAQLEASHLNPASEVTTGIGATIPCGAEDEDDAIEVDATAPGVDPEIVSIFVEEAREILESMRALIAAIRSQPDDLDNLSGLRRSYHTLKGSGRMAGLHAIGDAAWTIESLLNDHLEAGRPASDELINLASLGRDLLAGWIEDVALHGRTTVRNAALAGLATLVAVELNGSGGEKELEVIAGNATPTEALSFDAAPITAGFAPAEGNGPVEGGHLAPTTSALLHLAASEEPLPRTAQDQGNKTSEQYTPAAANERRLVRDDVDEELLSVFLDEVRDLVPLVGNDLRALRSELPDPQALASLRRTLHTIKGGARMVGAIRLGELVHIMEGQLEDAPECSAISADVLDLLEAEFDRLMSGFEALERHTPEPEAAPPRLDSGDGPSDFSSSTKFGNQPNADRAPLLSSYVRVGADTLDQLLNDAGEISIARGRVELEVQTFKQALLELTDSVGRLRNQLREIEIQAETRLQATQNQAISVDPRFDPLEFDRFTRFQELTRLTAESLHDITAVQRDLLNGLEEVKSALSAQSRINRGLQDDLLRLRTVSFQDVAERLHRVVRQATRETGKKAALHISGGQTEIDRSVLERIAAPLEHLVRNAVIHGIESFDARLESGKPEIGKIRLALRQESSHLLISLSDDGRGIDRERVRSRAIELGWLPAGASPPSSDLEQMILLPGFSTATTITELAGRGVGMDVVASEVQALGGRLNIASEPGKGTTFTISVPVTLAVANGLLVTVAGRRWAILSNLVEQVQEVPAIELSELESSTGLELEWLGQRYPTFYLPHLLGEHAAPAADRPKHFALLLRSEGRRLGVLVDQIAVNQDLVLKKIGAQVARLPGINGASVLPDGEIVLLVNPIPLLDREQVGRGRCLQPGPDKIAVAPLVMVVDDSLTVRSVTSRLLERNGYRVTSARDGLDALQQLEQATPDVLLVDIEMPRMDGFDLTRNLKATERTSSIPIIMITSRLAQKHREHANQLGVNVYLGKPFNEQELLAHVASFATSAAAA